MSTETKPVADLNEMLDQEVPCTGIRNRSISRTCDKPAVVRWTNPHNCVTSAYGHAEKCLDCWMALYQLLARNLVRAGGSLTCPYCRTVSYSVLAHTDYRPF